MISILSKSKVGVYALLLLNATMVSNALATDLSSARRHRPHTVRRELDLVTPAVAGVCIGVAIYVAKSDIEDQYKKSIYPLLVTNVLLFIIDQYRLYRPARSFFSNKKNMAILAIFILSGVLPLILALLYPKESSPIRDYP